MSAPVIEPDLPADELGHTAITGVAWSAVQRWVTRLTGFATVILTTRLLAPSDFGTVAVAMSVLPLIYLMVDMGFGTYLVQAKDPDAALTSTVFWYALGAGLVLAGCLAAGAPLLAASLDVPEATPIIFGLVPLVVLVSVGGVPTAILCRQMRFRTLAVQSCVAALLSQVAAVVLALLGTGAWALVGQALTAQLSTTVFAWVASGWRPSLLFRLADLRGIVGFGANVVAVEIVALLRTWAENIIIVSTLGVVGLGYLNVAQRLILAAQDLSAAAVLPVTTVFFAKVRDSAQRLRTGYLRAVGLTYAAVVPIMVLIAIAAPRVVPLVFGRQWDHSVAPTQALAVAGILTLAATLDQTLFYGCGRPSRWFRYALAIDVLTVATTAVLVHWGLLATVLGLIGVALVATAWRWRLVGDLLGISARATARPFFRVLLAALVASAAGMAAFALLADANALVAVALTGLVIGVVHLGVVRLVLAEEYAELVRLVRRVSRRLGALGRGCHA
ncbi:lipopolysaccharide biosynthesis protein [Nocardioides nematodiphilus]|uniref:lipopolysaccharide biosynthesis protein n=1 Tax=Nocardioides nematodiphilus TaxID=2849669 RepID=UPI001CD972D7|nr:lipopolysaccharide biosynthesis protein [Nocardioides nematodiphilus]MCA1983053.1 lipopolysaccharide biosynthesis protein [Nocardioides nematodiphilus]